MSKQLRIELPDDWADISDQNPDGPVTFVWDDEEAQGALQISTAEYASGKTPAPTEQSLVQFVTDFGLTHQWGDLAHVGSGRCTMGLYGTAIFRGNGKESPGYCQLWMISNGSDFVFATFFASGAVSPKELADAQQIAEEIDFR